MTVTSPRLPELTTGAAYRRVILLVIGTFGLQIVSALESAGLPDLAPGWALWRTHRSALSVLLGLSVVAFVMILHLRLRAVLPMILLLPALALTAPEPGDAVAALSAGLWAVVSAWLAVELTRGLGRPAVARRVPVWRAGVLAMGVKAAATPLGAAIAVPLALLGVNWGDGLGITPESAPLEYPVRTVAAGVEELVRVAAIAVILTAARRPLWEIYAVAITARVLPHRYAMPAAVSVIALAAGTVFFYLRYGRVWPLVIAHAIGNLVGSYGGTTGGLALTWFGAIFTISAVWTLTGRPRSQPFSIRTALGWARQTVAPGRPST